MIVPVLRSHQGRHSSKCQGCGNQGSCLFPGDLPEELKKSEYTHSYPYCKCIERSGIGIVTLPWLVRVLVKIYDDCNTCHYEEQNHDPPVARVTVEVPQEPCQTKQQRKKKIGVARLVILHVFRHIVNCTSARFVNELYAGDPVAADRPSITLNIILPAAEVPHEVPEIHESELVTEHKLQVLAEGGNTKGGALPALRIGNLYRFAAGSGITFINLPVIGLIAPHSGKQGHESFVIFPYSLTVGDPIFPVDGVICGFSLSVVCNRSVIVRPVEERTLSVLLTVQVIEQGKRI